METIKAWGKGKKNRKKETKDLSVAKQTTMHSLFSFLLLFSILALSLSDSDPNPFPAERSALLLLKSSARPDPLSPLSRWSPSSPHCSWPGVTCDPSSSHVTSLNLSDRLGLGPCPASAPFRLACPDPTRRKGAGELAAALGNLTELRTLSLPFHRFRGGIPGSIWRLENLQVLDLEGNLLTGTLGSVSRFPKGLKVLNLASNLISGEIPLSLSECEGLETLDLANNQINGSIPGFICKFGKLRELNLGFNQIEGNMSEKIGDCKSLEVLDLSGNDLVGGIPRSLGDCSEMRILLLFANWLDGSIPWEIGRLRKIRVLDVSRNSLSGPVPVEIGNCMDLSVLVLSNSYDPMIGEGSSNFVGSDEFNYFQGGISEKITSLPNLRILWAPRATLEGEFPKNWGACMSLEMVNLGGNFFTGEIPKGFGACKNVKILDVSSNNLTGWLREELPVSCIYVFDVSGNKLSGTIPKFIYKQCPQSTFPRDDVPALYSSFFAYRTYKAIDLPSFEYAGYFAVYHNFGRNNFSGSLPPLPTDGFGNQFVYAFLADGNSLMGSLNDTLFGKCDYFNSLILNLSNNLIVGEVPSDIGDMCRSLRVLNVAGNRITGVIPQSVGSLGSLVGLDLSVNRLQGQIPSNFGELKGLNYLSLAGNNLSGQIPAEFDRLLSLQLLDLSSNSLTGEIPGSLVNLKNLTILLLQNNKLSGNIPSGFANATLSIFNISYNNLSEPLTLNASTLGCNSVIGNPLLHSCHVSSLSIPPSYVQGQTADLQSYTDSPLTPGNSPPDHSSGGFSSIEIASITSASAIVAVLLALIILYIYTRRCTPGSVATSLGRREVTIFVDIGVPLTYEGVVRATGNFNASNCIGNGGFGATYKAEIQPGVLVAIKRLSVGRIQGVQQFHAEVKTLGRWQHPNLVTLIGYHIGDEEMFLIYNYLPGGNLEKFIQERSKRAVDWRMIHKIALDVAKALAYLHDQCIPRILHRDVKPSNILLDNDFNAYLSDFGLARLLGNSETHATTGVAGTFGYVAPEYAMTCRVSDKADVYSYGVVLLELISDKKALDPSFSPFANGFNIVAWACMLLEQGRAREFFTEGLWNVAPHDDLVEMLHLAVKCTVESLTVRPSMGQVVSRLRELQPLRR